MTAGRRGFGVTELLVALAVGLLVAGLVARALAAARTAVEEMRATADRLVTVRVAREVVGGQGRAGGWTEPPAADSVAVRAYRGVALVCPTRVDSITLTVRVAGVRRASAEKDSVALLRADGSWVVRGLAGAALSRAPCPGAARPADERWTLASPAPPDAVLARWFERGSFHLAGGALRYRRGRAGRQPLTPAVLSSGRSRFTVRPDGRVEVRLDFDDGSAPWTVGLGRGPGG